MHAFAYGVLTFCYLMCLPSEENSLVLIGIVMMLASIAGLDELTQSFVGRSTSIMDFWADMVGIFGVVLSRRGIVWLRRMKDEGWRR
jgi:VanZ family protein